jgi:hypothetical protein
MSARFDYGIANIRDLKVRSEKNKKGETVVREVHIDGEPYQTSNRFWNSLHVRFGFTSNIFRYFQHEEVFRRIGDTVADGTFRYCAETPAKGKSRLLAVTTPGAPIMRHDELVDLLGRYESEEIRYHNGVVTSRHAPRAADAFSIAGDNFQNKFVLDTPIDGYGRPQVYLSMVRQICSNGAIGYSPAFRSELNVGKAGAGVEYALVRVLDGFNNEEGYVAMRQRFESATRSWASVHEVNGLYRTLIGVQQKGDLTKGALPIGGDGAAEVGSDVPWQRSFRRMSGDLTEIYGLANLDTLTVKRQRTLPAACKVYDLLNFATEIGTHHATVPGNRALQSYVGTLISGEYDLEGTADHFGDWRDFFINNADTTDTLASLHRR